MLAADPPPPIVTTPVEKPPDVVVSRDTHSDILASQDTPLPLIKARKAEDAVLRQTIFLTSTLTVVRPAAGAGQPVLRWTYEPYLQRQFCLTSITGLFGCAAAEVEELTEKAAGEAPVTGMADGTTSAASPAAEEVRAAVAATLRARADALFEDDRRLKLDPMLKAAGVRVRRGSAGAGSARR